MTLYLTREKALELLARNRHTVLRLSNKEIISLYKELWNIDLEIRED